MQVIATAGHVDHGKSTLVHALTGMDMDRLTDERSSGLTIDLGFAWTKLPSGREVGFIDVPGHHRFIKNMLAGVGSIDTCLFVVSATEGWKAQSEEHLRILDILGLQQGIIALTRCNLIDEPMLESVQRKIEGQLEGSFLESAPMIPLDSISGFGLDQLKIQLDGVLLRARRAEDLGRPRLWIDRAFTISGAGTIITGTLTGGKLDLEDSLVVIPGKKPDQAALPVRVRRIQTNNVPHPTAQPGNRIALNLAGVSLRHLQRGQAVVRPSQWEPSDTVDATLIVLGALEHNVERRGAYVAHIGSGLFPVILRPISKMPFHPGETGLVRLNLTVKLPLLPGDKYILRDSGRSETVGGGEVLDVSPVLPTRSAAPDRSIDRVIIEHEWIEADLLNRLTGEVRVPDVGGRWIVAPKILRAAEGQLREAVANSGDLGLDIASLSERDRSLLQTLRNITIRNGRATLTRMSPENHFHNHPYIILLRDAPYAPTDPTAAGVDPIELRELLRQRLLVRIGAFYFLNESIELAVEVVERLLGQYPRGLTVAAVRDALGTTRKHAIPLLLYLDSIGVTVRRGELRFSGSRFPEPASPPV